MEIFLELAGIIFIATLFSILMRILRQPLIVGYILAGIFVGPYFLNLIKSKDHIELFSKIGITILLFIVGLNLSPKVIKEVGKVSLFTGIGQILFTSIIGFMISLALGIDKIAAVYIAIALTFSSTIIVLKLLSDKGDLNKLYGKIAVGFLLVQDIAAAIILLLASSFSTNPDTNLLTSLGFLFLKSAAIIIILYFVSQYIFPKFGKLIASSQELLFLFSITWGFGLASLFYLFGLSIEIGALIAGVIISMTPFAYEIGSRLKPLRDFFIVLFFVLLGSQMVLGGIGSLILPAIILSIFVLIGNPIIVIILMNVLGFKRRTGFMAGLTVAQISEFSLILAALGFNLGHLSQDVLSLITMVGLITIAGSTYFILYSDEIYSYVSNLLKYLELRKQKDKELGGGEDKFDLILFGYDRVGNDFVNAFSKLEKPYLVVDFNPESIKSLTLANIPFRYGDAQDIEFISELNLSKIKMAASTIPDFKTNMLLVGKIRDESPNAIIIVISHDAEDAEALYEKGATYVIMPHYLGARFATNMIGKFGFDKKGFEEERDKHLEHLAKRKTWTEDDKTSSEEKTVEDEKNSK